MERMRFGVPVMTNSLAVIRIIDGQNIFDDLLQYRNGILVGDVKPGSHSVANHATIRPVH